MKREKRVQFILLAMLCCFIQSLQAVTIENGDFEDGLDKWRYFAVGGAQAEFTIVNQAYSGNNALSMNIIGVNGGDYALDRDSNRIPAIYGDVFKIEFAAWNLGDENTHLLLSLSEFNEAGYYQGFDSNYRFDPNSLHYSEHSFSYAIQRSDTAYINIAFRIEDDTNTKSAGHFLIDAVQTGKLDPFYNNGFEDGLMGWRTYAVGGATGEFSITNDAYEGFNALSFNITNGGGDHGCDRENSRIPVEPLTLIKVSAATKRLSDDSTHLTAVIAEFNEAGNHLGDTIQTLASGNDNYAVDGFTYRTKEDTAKININFRIEDSSGSKSAGHYLIDDVQLNVLPRFYNSDFENDLEGWRTFASQADPNVIEAEFTITNDAYQGHNALLMNIITPTGDCGFDRENMQIAVDSLEVVQLGFFGKKLSDDESVLRVTLVERDKDYAIVGETASTYDLDSEFSHQTMTYPIQHAETAFINIAFRSVSTDNGSATPGQYIIDAVELNTIPRLFNGGFEEGMFSWRSYAVAGAVGTFTLSDDAFSGSQALRITISNSEGDHAVDRDNNKLPVQPGELLTIRFAAKSLTTEDNSLRLTLSEHDKDSAYLGDYGIEMFKPTQEYGIYEFTYKVQNESCRKLNIGFTVFDSEGQNKSTGDFLIDEIKLGNPQYVSNYGFEQDFNSWRYYAVNGSEAEFTISDNAYEGQKAALINVTIGGGDHALDMNNNKVIAKANDKLLVSFAAQNVTGNASRLLLTISEYADDPNQTYLNTYGITLLDPPTGEYGEYDYYYTVQNPSTGLINIGFTVFDAEGIDKAPGSYLIDNVKLVKGNNLPKGDFNYDMTVDLMDLTEMTVNWMDTDACNGHNPSDMNHDCTVNLADLSLLGEQWLSEMIVY